MYDQVSQLVPVQQVDDIDEVHQLDPVHQVDHKDECSKISCKKDTIRWTNQGSKKNLFHLFFLSPGDILRGLIFNRLSGGLTPPRPNSYCCCWGGLPPPGENRTAAAAPSLVTLFSTVSQKCNPRLGISPQNFRKKRSERSKNWR